MRRALIATAFALGVALVIAGFFASSIESSKKMAAVSSDSEKRILRPFSNKAYSINLTKKGMLNIELSANNTVSLTVEFQGKEEYCWRDAKDPSWNVFLPHAGTWTLNVTNDNYSHCSYTIFYGLTLINVEVEHPYAWLTPPPPS